MCLAAIRFLPNAVNGYKLILIFNRDEYYGRPSKSLSWNEDIIGSLDMEKKRRYFLIISVLLHFDDYILVDIFIWKYSGGRISPKVFLPSNFSDILSTFTILALSAKWRQNLNFRSKMEKA